MYVWTQLKPTLVRIQHIKIRALVILHAINQDSKQDYETAYERCGFSKTHTYIICNLREFVGTNYFFDWKTKPESEYKLQQSTRVRYKSKSVWSWHYTIWMRKDTQRMRTEFRKTSPQLIILSIITGCLVKREARWELFFRTLSKVFINEIN